MQSEAKHDIGELLPHAGHMLLLDELLDHSPSHVSCGLTIRSDTAFCESDRGVPSWLGIEYMAQTANVYSGLEDRWAQRDPAICLLLGARNYEVAAPYFAIGSELKIVASLVLRDEENLVAFDCKIYSRTEAGENVVASGDIKAYRPRDLAAILRGERPF